MLRRLIAFSLTQRIFMLLLAGLVAALGAYAFRTIPIDAFPNVSPVQVKMILKAPGMTPEEVESRVITPLEMELLGIPRQTIRECWLPSQTKCWQHTTTTTKKLPRFARR